MTSLITAPTTPDLDSIAISDGGALLTESVRVTTGIPTAQPRDGQGALHSAIVTAMESRSHTAGQAPTGSGKSFAALAAAFLAAIKRGERTVISTDSLALMGQLQDKDVQIVTRAATTLYPEISVEVAFLKGVSNYIDPAKVVATAQALTGGASFRFADLADQMDDIQRPLRGLDQFTYVEHHEQSDFRRLVAWACRQYADSDDNSIADRHACPIENSPAMWAAVSSSSSESDDGTRFGVTSKIELARLRAERADIVVTNHSLLAVQAALAVPVVVGGARLGVFAHIIADEAHTLPGHVRSQGATKLSGGVLARIGRSVARATGNASRALDWKDAGEHVAEELERELRTFAQATRDGLRRVTEIDTPLSEVEQLVRDWVKVGKKLLGNRENDGDVSTRIKVMAAKDSLNQLEQTVTALVKHRTGWARWVEKDSLPDGSKNRAWWGANVSPIDVGFLLRDNLWGYDVVDEDTGESERMNLSVSAISATMPLNYPYQAGLATQLLAYPSPFTAAYERSALFIPRVNGGVDFASITSDSWGSKRTFDVKGHALWAAARIVELVRANDGRALILSATAREGRAYTERLRRELPNITVHSQWDGGSTTRLVQLWRDDTGSVLVGTKSMMTGVDAPGETCSLVIIDRIPRSPSNPLDDARVEQIHARIDNRYEAQRAVYAVDAALLLQQAAGRLIRTSSDTGMVAVLDPRLLKATKAAPAPLAYPENTRATYMDALRAFGVRMTRVQDAVSFLHAER